MNTKRSNNVENPRLREDNLDEAGQLRGVGMDLSRLVEDDLQELRVDFATETSTVFFLGSKFANTSKCVVEYIYSITNVNVFDDSALKVTTNASAKSNKR